MLLYIARIPKYIDQNYNQRYTGNDDIAEIYNNTYNGSELGFWY